jgi:hypothetical protein
VRECARVRSVIITRQDRPILLLVGLFCLVIGLFCLMVGLFALK